MYLQTTVTLENIMGAKQKNVLVINHISLGLLMCCFSNFLSQIPTRGEDTTAHRTRGLMASSGYYTCAVVTFP